MFARVCFAATLLALAGCPSEVTGPVAECTANEECRAGEICDAGGCIAICITNANCMTGLVCVSDRCVTPSGLPPVITNVDSTGPTDGAMGRAAHHLENRLVVEGENLTGSTVTLDGTGGTIQLDVCAEADSALTVELPAMLQPDTYILTVTNQSGMCSANLPILAGETGPVGPTGPTGPQGMPGMAGMPGSAGRDGIGGGLLLDLELDEMGAVSTFGDSSQLGNDATVVTGGVTSGAAGHSGQAVDFSGGAITVAAGNTIPHSPTMRAEAWARPDALTGTTVILERPGAFVLRQVAGNIEFEITGQRGGSMSCTASGAGNALTASVFSHVAGWYDGMHVGVMVDGVVQSAVACAAGPLVDASMAAFNVGGSVSGVSVSQAFSGRIDSVRLWSTVFSFGSAQNHGYILIADERPGTTVGGNMTPTGISMTTVWNVRTLNTIRANVGGYAALAGNQVTLQPGTYRCEAHVTAYEVDMHQSRLFDVTNGQAVAYGTNAFSQNSGAYSIQPSVVKAHFSIGAPTVFRLETVTNADGGGTSEAGRPRHGSVAYDGPEVYNLLECHRQLF